MESSSSTSLQDDTVTDPRRSAPELLYPSAPEINERIVLWLNSSSPAIMSALSETHSDDYSNLGDSTYDFIETDGESRDGNATESSSTDFGRPDDVASLADTESEDEDEDEDSNSERSRFIGADPIIATLDGPTQTPTIGQSATFLDDADRTLAHSIEFEEPLSLGDENVSVKHTVADFSEEETAKIVENLRLRNPPKRLAATIRQTMTRQGLSTKEPLRILYVGCHTAKQDIIRKIGSSVAASVGHGLRAGSLDHRPSQLYNVVPITAFGSEKPPEIELMQSSGYQIKVEDLSDGVNIKYEDRSDRPDILKLIVDEHYTYDSVPESSGYVVEPAWELPHVAIFYCSENDTVEMKRARTITRSFMNRHKVPSIFISHRRTFDKTSGTMVTEQHPIHMCLESRDPNGPRNAPHQRFPIDLDSFKTIDARQMNRNLAYLTGLHEPLDKSPQPTSVEKAVTQTLTSDIEKTSYNISESVNFIRTRTGAELRALFPVAVLLLGVFAALVGSVLRSRTISGHAVSINGNLAFTEPMSVISTTAAIATSEGATSLMTSTETRTATRTITVIRSESLISNSLALKPSMELSKVNEKSQNAASSHSEEKPTICSAEVLGDREILIRIPSATKLSWLTKEAMSLNVSRDNLTVETERVYTTTDGIVLQFSKKDAYGVLNISVVTRRKPKVNEIFRVDFGSSWQHDLEDLLFGRLYEHVQMTHSVMNSTVAQIKNFGGRLLGHSAPLSELTRHGIEEVRKLAAKQTVNSSEQVTKAAKAISIDLAKWSAIISKEIGMQISEAKTKLSRARDDFQYLQKLHIREPLDGALLRAQVQSKLYWLKLQGKLVEYQDYEVRAAKATKRRIEEGARARRKEEDRTRKEGKALKREKMSCRKKNKKGCSS